MKLRHLSQRLIIAVLLFGLCVTGTLIALNNHTRSVLAASNPYYVVTVGGQKYAAQYVGGGSSSHNSSSASENVGKWNEYIMQPSGKWGFWGQLSGTNTAYFNKQGKIVGGVNVNVPGIGHVDTYGAEQTLGPDLPALQFPYVSPSQYTYQGSTSTHETYLGTRTAERFYTSRSGGGGIGTTDCQVDAGNLDYGHLGWQTDNVEMTTNHALSAEDSDCIRGQTYLQEGDGVLTNYFNHLVQHVGAVPNTNAPVVASLQQPQIVLSSILAITSTIFFVGAITSSNICTFSTCSNTAKKVLAAISITMAVFSAIFGVSATIVAGEVAAGAAAAAVGLGARGGLAAEAVGALEMAGAAGPPALAAGAAAEAEVMAGLGVAIAVVP